MEKFITSDRTDIHYVSLGEGAKTIIFLHGWTSSVTEWLPFASALADHYRVVCWDARGHGTHPYLPETEMSIPKMADDLAELIQHLEIENAILVGHSMGALTAWEYIKSHGQDKLAGLCVIDQSPKLVTTEQWTLGVYSQFDTSANQALIALLSRDFPEGVLNLIAMGHNQRSRENYENNSRGFQMMREYLSKLNASLLTRCWESITQQDYRDVLPRIHTPCLLIYGDQSQFYSIELAQWVSAHIPQSTLSIYPNSDHSPHMWHKERFIYDLKTFVEAL